jgi:hypothetical protein
LDLLMSDERGNTPQGGPQKSRKRPWARPLGELVLEGLDPLTRQRGFAGAELLSHWPEIAGERLANHSRPLALRWPVRGEKADPDKARNGATLEIAVSPAFALDLQYAAPQLIERLNALFGWRCVEKLRLLQRPIAAKTAAKPPLQPLSIDDQRLLEERLRKIDDPELRQALFRLGDGVIRRLKTQ